MIADKPKIKIALTDLLLVIVSLIFFFGIRFIFPVCDMTGEMVMSCHWAGEALKTLSIVLLLIALVHVFSPDGRMKIGIDLSIILIGIFAIRLPGGTISICRDQSMRCHTTLLWNTIVFVIMILLCILDILIFSSRISKEKHKRPAEEETS